ncbi:MAG: ATP-dependent zinc metalloprotease FtsH [Bacteroidia bacterium]|nr:ATP-dependent zinc metalloprotease FtsH [Bacteroidia bacterium]MCC6768427.1 ATP-dependent zinc metalloprotease FtsH [Bacteroidia bacterium]
MFPGNSKSKIPGGSGGANFYWLYAVIVLLFVGSFFYNANGPSKEIQTGKFIEMLQAGDVQEITVINKEFAEITIRKESLSKPEYRDLKSSSSFTGAAAGAHYMYTIGSVEELNKLIEKTQANLPPEKHINPNYQTRRNWGGEVLNWIILFAVVFFFWMFLLRRMGGGGGGGQIFNIGKSRAQLFDKDTHVSVTFDNVAGLDEAKIEIREIVDFLKNPKKYTVLGGKIPRGALLVGPPGTGKTLLAKAVAGEAQVPFFSLSGSDFVEMFVGVGASRVRDLFKQAKEKAPSIIFIDEIDAIGRARGKNPMAGANDERENTLNQLLTEMDGFGTNNGVIILAATNRADILDRALMRPGRFDRQIYVELPDLNGRKEIFKVHLKPIKTDQSVDIDFLARQTPGFSGADIANVCNEAALIAARKNKEFVGKQDFLDAVDRIIGGLEKKNKIISQHEKKVIAYHEAGHATVSWLLEHASPLVKVTIVPRGQSLGAAWYLPEERQISTFEQMFDEICAALGGRAAEDIVFGKVSTGALSDLEKITKQAYAMVSIYGLNNRIGNISFYDSSGQSEYSFGKPYSEQTAQTIDEEVKKLIDSAYEHTRNILLENREKLSALAAKLLEREVIFREDLEEIFGKRPFERDQHEDTAGSISESYQEMTLQSNGAQSGIENVSSEATPAENTPVSEPPVSEES